MDQDTLRFISPPFSEESLRIPHGRVSDAPEGRRKCDMVSQDGTSEGECALPTKRVPAARVPRLTGHRERVTKQGAPGNYKRCHWRGVPNLPTPMWVMHPAITTDGGSALCQLFV